jgi:microcystin-dependent protein
VSQPFVGEIRMFGGSFAPAGWAFCDGRLVPISQNDALFNLIGTTYGGDGQTTFALPDLRGRIPVHQGSGPGLSPYVVGQSGGVEQVTLTIGQLPAHSHPVAAANVPAEATAEPGGSLPAIASESLYGAPSSLVPLDPTAVGAAPGGSQPHDNLAPYLCVSFIISLFGIFPSRS